MAALSQLPLVPLFHYISFYCAFCVFRRRSRRHPGNPRCGTLRRRHTPAPEKHVMRARPMKTRRPHPATRTGPPASGLRPRPAEPGNYRSHGGSRRTQRTADNPPAAQSTLPHASAFPACATPYAQARLRRQHCIMIPRAWRPADSGRASELGPRSKFGGLQRSWSCASLPTVPAVSSRG
jgi:hypothetical protein